MEFVTKCLFVILICTFPNQYTAEEPAVPPAPTQEQFHLAETYFNFTMGISEIYSEALINDTLRSPPTTAPDGVIITSVLGLVHQLATLKEQPLSSPVAFPLFDKFLKLSPKNIPEAYELLRGTLDKNERDLVITSQVYSSEDIKMTPALTKLHLEVVKADLKDPATITKINSGLKEKLTSPLEEAYIPEGLTLSPAVKAFLVDTVHVTESWPVEPKKIEKAKFGLDPDMVEMVEMNGIFGLIESVESTEVTIPFQNGKRFISFILPNTFDESKKPGSEPPKMSNSTQVKIQLPVFKHTAREVEFAGSPNCDFKKEESFLQLLDDVTFVSLDASKFEIVSISGSQVNNVALFKEAAAKASADTKKADKPLDPSSMPPMMDHDKLPEPAPSAKAAEKLLVFNRPFTFSVVDVNLGVLFSGSVESLQKSIGDNKPKSTVFGMEKELAYLKCL